MYKFTCVYLYLNSVLLRTQRCTCAHTFDPLFSPFNIYRPSRHVAHIAHNTHAPCRTNRYRIHVCNVFVPNAHDFFSIDCWCCCFNVDSLCFIFLYYFNLYYKSHRHFRCKGRFSLGGYRRIVGCSGRRADAPHNITAYKRTCEMHCLGSAVLVSNQRVVIAV